MAEVHCQECETIRENVPELLIDGFTSEMCTSLKNDTGLKPSVGNNDCTDLDNLNECLVGNMITELERYDVCDWKKFMEQYATNDYITNKAIICAICGMWTQIHEINHQIELIWECLNS